MESVKEYIDFMFNKLNELAIEDISYSDYDQMTDWLGEIRKQVKRLEKKQEPMRPKLIMKTMSMCLTKEECGPAYTCDCGAYVGYLHEYCNDCGQKLDWED